MKHVCPLTYNPEESWGWCLMFSLKMSLRSAQFWQIDPHPNERRSLKGSTFKIKIKKQFSQFLEDFLHARRWMNGRRAASGNWSMQQNSTLRLSMPEDGHSQAHMPSARHIPPVLWHWQRLDITLFHQQLSVRPSCTRSLLFCEGFTRDWHSHRSPAALQ